MPQTKTPLQKAAEEIVDLEDELVEWQMMAGDELIPSEEHLQHSQHLTSKLAQAVNHYQQLLEKNDGNSNRV